MGRRNQTAAQRQESIYKFIKTFLKEKGYPPSVREIGQAVGLRSSSTVHSYLSMLESNGMIRRAPSKSRTIDLLEEKPWSQTISVPLVGTVAAGVPIFADENIEGVYPFPVSLLGARHESTFMLRVQGDSMIKVGILNGDYIIAQQRDTASDGEIVVALVDGETATVKRFFREPDCIRLQPENDAMEPFYEKDVRILGKVIGVYRQM